MTRIYLSPAASTFAKIGLVMVEILIGLYNLVTYPVRTMTFKAYCFSVTTTTALYMLIFHADLMKYLTYFVLGFCIFTANIFITKAIHKVLKKKVSPRVALLINSPLGIPRNRFYEAY